MKRGRKKFGPLFAEKLAAGKHNGRFLKHQGDISWEDQLIPNYRLEGFYEVVSAWRLVSLACIFLLAFFGIFLRLFHLQVVLGSENRERADFNRVQIRTVHAPRGVVYDRNGQVLAENSPGFRLKDRFLSRDEAMNLEVKNDPVFSELEIDALRFYPLGEITAHVLGYVGQISAEELQEKKYHQYRVGDRLGRSGIEQVYEDVLKGKDGAEIVEVNASGGKLRTIRKIDPEPGNNLYLSLDADLQKVAFKALKTAIEKAGVCCGTVITSDPKTGEILAMVSYPSFDGNVFADPKKSSSAVAYFENSLSPLMNRAIAGTYPPGSTFKITSALAGLISGKINRDTEVEDTGVVAFGPYKFTNWYFTGYGKTEGMVNLEKALKRSNDIYFYKIGEWVGEKVIGQTAKKVGFGKKLGIDLPGEEEGLVPDDDWKKKHFGDGWYLGDTLHLAIGQGFILTTPLQVLVQTELVANNGFLKQPHLATKITRADGSLLKEFNAVPTHKDLFKKEDLELVKKGLMEVTRDGGTAWPLFNFKIPTAGKTGTAEFGDPKGRTHAWYTTFAPVVDPEIVLTVLVEAGGEGSSVAAPIAKEIYTWYFNPDKSNIQSLDTFPASESAKTLGE